MTPPLTAGCRTWGREEEEEGRNLENPWNPILSQKVGGSVFKNLASPTADLYFKYLFGGDAMSSALRQAMHIHIHVVESANEIKTSVNK